MGMGGPVLWVRKRYLHLMWMAAGLDPWPQGLRGRCRGLRGRSSHAGHVGCSLGTLGGGECWLIWAPGRTRLLPRRWCSVNRFGLWMGQGQQRSDRGGRKWAVHLLVCSDLLGARCRPGPGPRLWSDPLSGTHPLRPLLPLHQQPCICPQSPPTSRLYVPPCTCPKATSSRKPPLSLLSQTLLCRVQFEPRGCPLL